jgi:hypothetical protein
VGISLTVVSEINLCQRSKQATSVRLHSPAKRPRHCSAGYELDFADLKIRTWGGASSETYAGLCDAIRCLLIFTKSTNAAELFNVEPTESGSNRLVGWDAERRTARTTDCESSKEEVNAALSGCDDRNTLIPCFRGAAFREWSIHRTASMIILAVNWIEWGEFSGLLHYVGMIYHSTSAAPTISDRSRQE